MIAKNERKSNLYFHVFVIIFTERSLSWPTFIKEHWISKSSQNPFTLDINRGPSKTLPAVNSLHKKAGLKEKHEEALIRHKRATNLWIFFETERQNRQQRRNRQTRRGSRRRNKGGLSDV